MEVNYSKSGDIMMIKIAGAIDTASAQQLFKNFPKLLEIPGINHFHLDLSKVSAISSMGISGLLKFYQSVNKLMKEFEIIAISDYLHDQFIDMQLDRIFTIRG
ncbi:MAG: STAS domain-containing protein [Spirochaetales bacterium]|nr:STAS domain-containing protein [Spirochaetales bacterium]